MKPKVTIILSLILAGLLALAGGCTVKYELYSSRDHTTSDRLPQYSFEYPVSFEIGFMVDMPNKVVDIETFHRESEQSGWLGDAMHVSVSLVGPSGYADSSAWIDSRLNGPISYNSQHRYQKGTVRVAGIPAEYATFTCDFPSLDDDSFYETTTWLASIEHAGYLWNFLLVGPSITAGETEKYFKHLLDTFRFLE